MRGKYFLLVTGCALLSCLTAFSEQDSGRNGNLLRKPLPVNAVPAGLTELGFKEVNPEPQPAGTETELGFILFGRPATVPIYPNTKPLADERIKALTTFGALGEIVSVNFAIYPLKALGNLRVVATGLKSDGNVISAEDVDVRLVTYRNVVYPSYRSEKSYRKVPELLEKVDAASVPEKECQRYWLKIKIPDNAAAGLYTGTVTVAGDNSGKTFVLPFTLRVLPFKLLKDPEKHFTAYNYDVELYSNVLWKGKSPEWIAKAERNDYKAMREYGFDVFPTLYLFYDPKTKKICYIGKGDGGKSINEMLSAGLKGPVPVVFAGAPTLYKELTGKTMSSHHYIMPVPPPDEFYKTITRLVAEFEKERKAKGWPEFIYNPLDEVAAESKDFGVKVYKAFKDAGVKTYATKSPAVADAPDYADVVDIWCDPYYSIPYEKVIADKKHGYWCYPNNVQCAPKHDPLIFCAGGRMVYGYGLWRSGYTMLMPWIWRWGNLNTYLTPLSKGSPASGNQVDDNGEIIPAVYWDCIREGVNDYNYIYTLETAVAQRENSADPECRKLAAKGKALLQEIWDAVKPQPTYEDAPWNHEEFDGYRWRMAQMTEQLLKYPAANNQPVPSVIIDYKSKPAADEMQGFFRKQQAEGNIEIVDLGKDDFKSWKSVTTEGKVKIPENVKHFGNKCLLYDVTMDYQKDGGGENSVYLVGWPRIRMDFAGGLDMSKYDYVSFWVMVESERPETKNEWSPFYIDILSYDKSKSQLYNKNVIDLVPERVWIPITLSIKDMVKESGNQDAPWKCIKGIQFGISEAKYPDKTNIRFYLEGINLIKLKNPAISAVDIPSAILLKRDETPFTVSIMGCKEHCSLSAALLGSKGETVSTVFASSIEKDTKMAIDTSKLTAGVYTLHLEIKDASGKTCSKYDKTVKAIDGPASGGDKLR